MLLLAGALAFVAQSDKPRLITVSGCLTGSYLKSTSIDPPGGHTDRFQLRGSRELLKTLKKEHQGHELEVTGALIDPAKVMGGGKTKELGKKTKVYVSGRERLSTDVGLQTPSIDVQSFRLINDICR